MSLIQFSSKQRGFTLIELIITLVLDSIILVALIAIFVANLQHYRNTINKNRLENTLQAAMSIMSTDIMRAGYWANAKNDLDLDQNNNPFMASGVDITTGLSNTCILFSYDHSNNGILPAISSNYDDERYGYRVNNQILQTRPWGATFSCSATTSSWENVTDPNVVLVTALTFTLNTQTINTGPGTARILLRSVDITLTGRLTNDASITKTITQHVRIRNDKFQP